MFQTQWSGAISKCKIATQSQGDLEHQDLDQRPPTSKEEGGEGSPDLKCLVSASKPRDNALN
jgi:hypothetical protein